MFRSRFRTDSGAVRVLTSTVGPLAAICEKFVGMARLFGTDGVRGVANQDLTAELALGLGSAAARRLGSVGGHARRLAVVGRDPRASSEMLEAAVIAGVTSEGVDALRVGVLPTPAVAYLTSAYDADFGVMISASHNPMPDNGIKLFAAGGHKLSDEVEDKIEAAVAQPANWRRPTGAGVGRVHDLLDGAEHYVKHLVGSAPHSLEGIR
ncbi:MAG: phosphoglucosamine mutase, partial [Mycobacterium sp.]|nr:phosphoglucosamine mutase [Mycobacterium sp.]